VVITGDEEYNEEERGEKEREVKHCAFRVRMGFCLKISSEAAR